MSFAGRRVDELQEFAQCWFSESSASRNLTRTPNEGELRVTTPFRMTPFTQIFAAGHPEADFNALAVGDGSCGLNEAPALPDVGQISPDRTFQALDVTSTATKH